ncbi:neutrophil cytosol factor 1 [Periophthalmus magnuspinnatus]|uniref:neutrophil cytosol factor 1 n=1 Tax=Periophthalmus magnuspinnatus TaxID=409849 RepID=UPI00145B1577|nr:neutrophil cytosol factor 1 [Periophthalmus magnuspinnatus]
MEEVYVKHVEMLGFERRVSPSRHYVFRLMVKWSDDSEKLIYRTYPEIHTFHKSLKEMFPIEAGQIEKRDRIIPSLPAPRWVENERTSESKQSTLTEYSQALLRLPPHISRCSALCSFFRVRAEDENPQATTTLKRNETLESREQFRANASEISGPIILDTYRVIADFTKTSKHEINLHSGDMVEIVEKNQNGWWFCQMESKYGWVPASYLEPLDGPEEEEEPDPDYEGELYVTTRSYRAEQEDEISLETGETIEVIHKLLDGWWVVRKGEETGHFPSMFLQKAGKKAALERTNPYGTKLPPRRSTIRNAKSIHGRSKPSLSQDVYRRNSRKYLQQKSNRMPPRKHSRDNVKSPLREMTHEENFSEASSDAEQKKVAPVVPPRPSPELILERCTDKTRKRISLRSAPTASVS